jgi:hypothetical protein
LQRVVTIGLSSVDGLDVAAGGGEHSKTAGNSQAHCTAHCTLDGGGVSSWLCHLGLFQYERKAAKNG